MEEGDRKINKQWAIPREITKLVLRVVLICESSSFVQLVFFSEGRKQKQRNKPLWVIRDNICSVNLNKQTNPNYLTKVVYYHGKVNV